MQYVQCLNGHVREVPDDSEAAKLVLRRKQAGSIDALSPDECTTCLGDREEQLRASVRMCRDTGCAIDGDGCKNGCLFNQDLLEIQRKTA